MAWRESAHINRLKVNKIFSGGVGAWKEGPSGKELARIRSDYTFEEFQHPPIMMQDDTTTASNADTETNMMLFGQNLFYKTNIATATIFMPVMAAGGIDVGGDQVENDGCAIHQGITANDKHAYTVGTDAAFFARLKFSVANTSGTDQCLFGFRKAEAHQADFDAYDELAALNLNNENIFIATIDNGAETVDTDTTDDWDNGETHTFEVRVSKLGVVTFLIDDVAPTTTAALTFDTGEVVVPFFQFQHSADPEAGAIILQEWEVGYQ